MFISMKQAQFYDDIDRILFEDEESGYEEFEEDKARKRVRKVTKIDPKAC